MPASRPALQRLSFDAVILHYSLFASYQLDDEFRDYLRSTDAYKVAFFQDEYIGCQRRFAFLNEHGIDCVYTCLEPHQFDAVYGRYTSVPTLRTRSRATSATTCGGPPTGSASPTRERTVDVGLPRPAAARLPRARRRRRRN